MLTSILESFNPSSVYRVVTSGQDTRAELVAGAALEGLLATAIRDRNGGIRHVVEIPGMARIMSAEVLDDCQHGKRSGYTLEVVP